MTYVRPRAHVDLEVLQQQITYIPFSPTPSELFSEKAQAHLELYLQDAEAIVDQDHMSQNCHGLKLQSTAIYDIR